MRGALAFFAFSSLLYLGGGATAHAQPAGTEPAADAAPEVHDLDAVLRAAQRHYPALRAARHRHEAARARLSEATFSPFFQFAGTAGLAIAPETRGSPIFSPDSQLPLSNTWHPIVRLAV